MIQILDFAKLLKYTLCNNSDNIFSKVNNHHLIFRVQNINVKYKH